MKKIGGKLLGALAKRKGKQVAKVLAADPEMKKMLKKSDDLEKDLVNYFKKKRKSDPDYASKMDALDYI